MGNAFNSQVSYITLHQIMKSVILFLAVLAIYQIAAYPQFEGFPTGPAGSHIDLRTLTRDSSGVLVSGGSSASASNGQFSAGTGGVQIDEAGTIFFFKK